MMTISVEDMQRDLLGYLRRVEAGDTLVLMQAGRPVAEIKPLPPAGTGVTQQRPFGLCAGEFVVPDDFNAPLPDDLLDLFEGTPAPARL